MAYSTEADCRLYAPQAPSGETFAAYINKADTEIDSALRSVFSVPLTPSDTFVVSISARLAAGEYLRAMYSMGSAEEAGIATALLKEARDALAAIRSDPTRITCVLASDPVDERGEILVAGDKRPPVFDMGRPEDWGRRWKRR